MSDESNIDTSRVFEISFLVFMLVGPAVPMTLVTIYMLFFGGLAHAPEKLLMPILTYPFALIFGLMPAFFAGMLNTVLVSIAHKKKLFAFARRKISSVAKFALVFGFIESLLVAPPFIFIVRKNSSVSDILGDYAGLFLAPCVVSCAVFYVFLVRKNEKQIPREESA